MDEGGIHSNPNPMRNANFLSRLLFWWLNPLFRIGYQRPLEVNDMYSVLDEDAARPLSNKLEREWNKELDKKKSGGQPSLRMAMIRAFGWQYALLGLFVVLEESTKVIQPVLLGRLLRFFSPETEMPLRDAYLYAAGISFCAMVLAVAHHPYFFNVQRVGMWLRIASCSLLYRKSLRLSNSAMGQTTTGQIVNLMSNDVNRFDQAVIFLHFLWVGPLQTIAVMVILWYEVGPASLAGLAVLVLLIPLQAWMGKRFSKLRHKTAIQTDERVRVMNEIISGMRVIKMYCWEKPFAELVKNVRKIELSRILPALYCKGANIALMFTCSRTMCYAVFVLFISTGNTLSVGAVFVALPLFRVLELTVALFIPLAIQFAAESFITLDRGQRFLLLDEIENSNTDTDSKTNGVSTEEKHTKEFKKTSNEKINKQAKEDGILVPLLSEKEAASDHPYMPLTSCKVLMNNVTASWEKDSEQITLKDINCEVKAGELLAVIGPVGCGKSSLLMSILKELPLSSGNIEVCGRVAYASQQPWVFSASLRQNILFGQSYNKAQYDKVLKTCALDKDIALFPHGDKTLVGERGVSLSGGQRARVSLARALYYDADIYLLDDPLSAVDAGVSRHLFDKCIMSLLKDKVRILVTHQLQYLQDADNIIILKEGEQAGMGTFNELVSSGIDFAELLKEDEDQRENSLQRKPLIEPPSATVSSSRSLSELGSARSLDSVAAISLHEFTPQQEEERRAEGTVSFKVYKDYFAAGANWFMFLLLVLLNILAQASYVISDWWLSYWSNQEDLKAASLAQHNKLLEQGYNQTNVTISTVDVPINISIFSALVASVFLFGLLRVLLFFRICINSSQELHNRAFASVVRAPVRFFDINPVGRILNRFSKDIGQMDDQLPTAFFDFVQCTLLICGIVFVAGIINPWVFIPVLPLGILFFLLRRYYLATSRDIKRLEGTTRSPVFSHLSATLQGLCTVRAFKAQGIFIKEFDQHQNLHTESWFLFLASTRWLAIRLDWICALFVTSVAMCCVLAKDNLNLDAGLVGLSLTYALSMMGLFQWAVRQSAEVENQMTSVERILEYSRLTSEAPLENNDKKPPPDWPFHGIITGEKAALKYYEDGPTVLRNINFCVRAKEKVGIVGRTGAGKSSLITMLFRLAEPTGVICIDGLNISELGLHDLRQKISIIPQDPVLFSGTVKKNLDPFNKNNDEALWSALDEVQLKPAIKDLTGGLQAEISEGGTNFSVGQRQLLCLARAVLRRNKILIIDEATANVDPRTDVLIQQTIRDKFKHCTVLTIAHRLNTIMDSDRVLVMTDGNIAEYDEPYTLLQDKEGLFYNMLEQTGKAEAERLTEVAKRTFYKNNSSTNDYVPDAQRSFLKSHIPSTYGALQLETVV